MFGVTHNIHEYLGRLQNELDRLDRSQVRRLADSVYKAHQAGRFIFVFGNGGSGATASHFAEDLGKNALRECDLNDDDKKRPRVISLSDNTSWITALGNDVGFDSVFVQQLMQYGQPGDLAIAISGSGNSPNVLAAVEWANHRGLDTFAVTAYNGGRLKSIAKDCLHVQLDDMGMAESVHLAVFHWIVEDIHARANREGRYAPAAQQVPSRQSPRRDDAGRIRGGSRLR